MKLDNATGMWSMHPFQETDKKEDGMMMRVTLVWIWAAAMCLLCNCSSKGPSEVKDAPPEKKEALVSVSPKGGFSEKGFAAISDKANKGEGAFDHALLKKAHEASAQARENVLIVGLKPELSDEQKAALEAEAKAAGFADFREFYKATDALNSARSVLKLMSQIESGQATPIQKAMAGDFVKKFTEADLRFVAGLK